MSATINRSPFLDFTSFTVDQTQENAPTPMRPAASSRSPFLSVYELGDGEDSQYDATREARALLLSHLYDEEFDEAVSELTCRGRAMHDAQLALGRSREEADRVVTQHFSQLIRASEAMVDDVARTFVPRAQEGVVEGEVDTFLERYAATEMDPEFENFFGKLLKKIGGAVKAVAGKAIDIAKNLALGPALAIIKRAIQPILKRVLQWAIGKLPASLQPIAAQLAQKLGFSAPPAPSPAAPDANSPAAVDAALAAASAGDPVQAAAGSEMGSLQQELDDHIVSALLAQNEVDLELEASQFDRATSETAQPVFAELDDARERFIRELGDLGAGESAEPAIQNFLPAILPALKIGLKIIGRPRVVNFLGGAIGALISKLVGPEASQSLGRAIADAGLKLMTLETGAGDAARFAPAAVAATVEETVTRVASLPDEVLDNQELLEGYVLEAFEQAAAANLPAVFSEETYRRRPDLLEAGLNAGWVLLPLRGPKRYKRCTRTFDIRVSPHLAEEIESFDGATLAEHLQDQLGMEDSNEADGRVYLYEALPGTMLTDIARGERETLGAGQSDEANATQLHPLTPEAAGALLGRPGLGRDMPDGMQRHGLAAGQRLYHFGVGRRPLAVPGHHRRAKLRKLLHLNLVLDGVQDQIRLCVFLSEVKAQKLAARLRQGANLGQITAGFERALRRRLHGILTGHAPKRVRIVDPKLRPGLSVARLMHALPRSASSALAGKLQAWLVQGLAETLKSQSQKVIASTEDAADGITFSFVIEHPPGFKELRGILTGRATAADVSAVTDAIARGAAPTVRVEVNPGHKCV